METLFTKGTRDLVSSYYEVALPRLLLALASRAPLASADNANTVFLVLGLCVRLLCGRIDDTAAATGLGALEKLVRLGKGVLIVFSRALSVENRISDLPCLIECSAQLTCADARGADRHLGRAARRGSVRRASEHPPLPGPPSSHVSLLLTNLSSWR
jgi:hypothetical protein